MQNLKTIDEVEAFFLKHGENIVDMLGGEVDRIEKELKVIYSRIKINDRKKKIRILLQLLYIDLIRTAFLEILTLRHLSSY